jgi:hypothetical protein
VFARPSHCKIKTIITSQQKGNSATSFPFLILFLYYVAEKVTMAFEIRTP